MLLGREWWMLAARLKCLFSQRSYQTNHLTRLRRVPPPVPVLSLFSLVALVQEVRSHFSDTRNYFKDFCPFFVLGRLAVIGKSQDLFFFPIFILFCILLFPKIKDNKYNKNTSASNLGKLFVGGWVFALAFKPTEVDRKDTHNAHVQRGLWKAGWLSEREQ